MTVPESRRPQPNTFIIGAPKCGTSALAHYLSEHPQVFFSKPKEPFYWATDHPRARSINDLHSLDAYLKLFAAADRKRHAIIAEGSTTYAQSRTAIGEILRFNPDARFILMLRNPVDVVHGMHGELRRHYGEDEPDFERAWHLQEARAAGRNLPSNIRYAHQLQYRDVATYAPQIRRLFDQVREQNRLVIVFDDFVRQTRESYLSVLQFLGLPDDQRTEFPRVNAAGYYRSHLVGRLAQDPPRLLAAPVKVLRSWYLRRGGKLRQFIHGLVQKESAREVLRTSFREELKAEFRDDVQEVSQLLARDLTHWTAPAAFVAPAESVAPSRVIGAGSSADACRAGD